MERWLEDEEHVIKVVSLIFVIFFRIIELVIMTNDDIMQEKEVVTMTVEAIGSRFKAIREQCKYTQKQIADYLGVDQSYISKFEKGERSISINVLEKACALFGCDSSCILDESKDLAQLSYCFRASDGIINTQTMECIADINKIAMNILLMRKIQKENQL